MQVSLQDLGEEQGDARVKLSTELARSLEAASSPVSSEPSRVGNLCNSDSWCHLLLETLFPVSDCAPPDPSVACVITLPRKESWPQTGT